MPNVEPMVQLPASAVAAIGNAISAHVNGVVGLVTPTGMTTIAHSLGVLDAQLFMAWADFQKTVTAVPPVPSSTEVPPTP